MDRDAINACAALVDKGDPDRFLAAMAGPVAARAALFPLYAFNLELARAPWVTREPMIAHMRLQFWREVVDLEEMKAHEVAAPLQALIRAGLPAAPLHAMIDAREAEIGTARPFDGEPALWEYLDGTGGALMRAAVLALGGPDSPAAADLGAAQGLANYLLALPALKAAGRRGLPEGEALAALAQTGLERIGRARPALRRDLPPRTRPALWAAWRTEGVLRRARARPALAQEGGLAEAEILRRAALIWRRWRGF